MSNDSHPNANSGIVEKLTSGNSDFAVLEKAVQEGPDGLRKLAKRLNVHESFMHFGWGADNKCFPKHDKVYAALQDFAQRLSPSLCTNLGQAEHYKPQRYYARTRVFPYRGPNECELQQVYTSDQLMVGFVELCKALRDATSTQQEVCCEAGLLPPFSLENLPTEEDKKILGLFIKTCSGQQDNDADDLHWHLVMFYMQPIFTKLQDMVRSLEEEPLTKEQAELLIWHMTRVTWRCDVDLTHKGEWLFEVGIQPASKLITSMSYPRMAASLLAAPYCLDMCFRIQQLQSTAGYKYIRKCRAPSCGRLFYTAKSNAAVCPGKRWARCKREWDSYASKLKKWLFNPQEIWDDDCLKEKFKRDYKPRKGL